MTLLIVIAVIFGLSLIPWLGMLLPTVMLTDAPGSTQMAGVRLMVGSCLSYPVVVIVGLLVAKVLDALGQPTAAIVVALAPLVNLAMAGLGGYLLWGRKW
jgi:hypothetical protein